MAKSFVLASSVMVASCVTGVTFRAQPERRLRYALIGIGFFSLTLFPAHIRQ
jgi:hypothetical protein